MTPKATLKRHADLLDRMADQAGVDLQEAALAGAVSLDQLSDAVLRCAECPDPDCCARGLAGEGFGGKPPEFCKNREMLGRLRQSSRGQS